jgi:TPR repeat protein
MYVPTSMRRALCSAILFASVAHAGLWEDGYADYQRKDYASAVAKWQVVAETGDREAQSLLGMMHLFGQGTPQSYPKAILWLRRAAAQGEPKAQFKLGTLYASGQSYKSQGLERDYQKAAMWFIIAEESGHPEAGKSLKKVTAEISPPDLLVAQRWAKTCIKREFKGCE